MSVEELQAWILSSYLYRDRGRFTVKTLKAAQKADVPNWKYLVALRALCEQGRLQRLHGGVYEKSPETRKWLTIPWRTHSNEELGLEVLL